MYLKNILSFSLEGVIVELEPELELEVSDPVGELDLSCPSQGSFKFGTDVGLLGLGSG